MLHAVTGGRSRRLPEGSDRKRRAKARCRVGRAVTQPGLLYKPLFRPAPGKERYNLIKVYSKV